MTKIRSYLGKNLHWYTLLLAIICATATVGYIAYKNGGIFTYYGDYNCQQICFYMHTHEMVKTGQIGWDWYTDLGANFIGSYSFYLLFSPFFWLTLPFSTETVPYLMAPLFVLKFSVSAITAYFFCARFVKDKHFAVIGGLLYAFSGYCVYNLFFNHFLDVVAFFPLILIGLEMLITENKHGPFALAVALNAIVNYWFFIGEVFFVILYFFIRLTDKSIENKFKAFIFVAFESVIGLLLSAVVVLPSVLAIIGNPRIGSDDILNGWGLWLYYNEQRVPAILASFFLPPDLPSKQNMFPNQGSQWSSMAGWLPLFGMTGVVAYLRQKKDWITKIIIACTIIAIVPVLNHVFVLFNNSYYDRWFYMFELMLTLATIKALEECSDTENNSFNYKKGLIPVSIAVTALILILFFTPTYTQKEWKFGLVYDKSWFIMNSSFAIASAIITFGLMFFRKKTYFKSLSIILTAIVCAAYGFSFILFGYGFANDHREIIEEAVGLYDKDMDFDLEDSGEFYRSDFYETFDNLCLYWKIPSIRCFHSIVPPSIMEFYPEVGVTRDVSSYPDYDLYSLRSLLSVKYLYADADDIPDDPEIYSPVKGFSYLCEKKGYYIYSNDNYIPMGFTYDHYITRNEYRSLSEEDREKILVSAIVLKVNQVPRYSSSLEHIEDIDSYLGYDDIEYQARLRNDSSSYYFKFDSKGFTSKIDLKKDNLVFFSVPYESGWKAYVNGKETAIEKVDDGFMAVFAKKGNNEIVFTYETPGLKMGALISISAMFIFIAYYLYAKYEIKKLADAELVNEFYEKHSSENEKYSEPELLPEEDLTVIRHPEDLPQNTEYNGPEEKIYPEL